MKNQFIALFAYLAFALAGNAQVNPNAIGLRGGYGNFGGGGEVTYQRALGSANRLEIDLGWRGNNGKYAYRHSAVSVIYHWVWNLDGGLNWYIGPGGQVGFYDYRYNDDFYNDGITVNLGGQIGLEYDFNDLGAPILLSIDSRPMWGFLGGNRGFGYGGAFAVRYTF